DGIELKVKFVIAHLQLMVDDYIPELAKHNLFLNLTPFWVRYNEEVCSSSDIVVLDKNLYEIPVETIHEVEPLITIFKGEEVFKA
ncbi:MAG: hypothetical protein MJ189_02955, partial [Coriobacteriales bacterium]|nr:hypothetical protein [Coriobacteriales bacterium]